MRFMTFALGMGIGYMANRWWASTLPARAAAGAADHDEGADAMTASQAATERPAAPDPSDMADAAGEAPPRQAAASDAAADSPNGAERLQHSHLAGAEAGIGQAPDGDDGLAPFPTSPEPGRPGESGDIKPGLPDFARGA